MTLSRATKATCLADVQPQRRRSDWGPWRLDASVYVLYPETPYRYEVDLEDCCDSAEVLDWLCQIARKTWATDAHVAGLIRAIDDVLNPQANLCSSGISKTLTAAQIRRLVRGYVQGATQ